MFRDSLKKVMVLSLFSVCVFCLGWFEGRRVVFWFLVLGFLDCSKVFLKGCFKGKVTTDFLGVLDCLKRGGFMRLSHN